MKNVLVTGANKGIGFEVAKKMAELGYFVYLCCRDVRRGKDALYNLKEEGLNNVELLQIDVSDLESVKKAKAELESKVKVLDILINNAAIAGPLSQSSTEVDVNEIRKIFDTNYFGTIQTTQAFLSLMQNAKVPVIVNVSSELGSLAMQSSLERNPNWNNFHAYGSSKTALNAFTIHLANELKNTKFKVNSVTPGYTATDLNNFAGLKTPAQGADPIVKIATIDENGPTGQFFKDTGNVAW